MKEQQDKIIKMIERLQRENTVSYHEMLHIVSSEFNVATNLVAKLYREVPDSDKDTQLAFKQNNISNLTYKGNSVGYIYEKMAVYRDQLLTMADALRMIGIDYSKSGMDNIERRKNTLQMAESIREKLDKLKS